MRLGNWDRERLEASFAPRGRWFRSWWAKKVKRLNAKNLRIPWMENRLAIYSLDVPSFESAEPQPIQSPGLRAATSRRASAHQPPLLPS